MEQQLIEQFNKLNSTAQEALVQFLRAVNEGTTAEQTPEQREAEKAFRKTMKDWTRSKTMKGPGY
ncbi:MAG: hypothetical protein NXI25_21050 [bacterium]|jgi:hypothetical protein|nr:hypothetical protein [bacterium]